MIDKLFSRHGPRLDAADQQWHLSTPSPYDPPLTYGGWNQCRALGLRIANLLHAREQKLNTPGSSDGVHSKDFASLNANGKRGANEEGDEQGGRKKRRVVKHKVVIHSSPFLRCLQTSAAVAAGLAQFSPSIETGAARKASAEGSSRSPNLRAASSPRLRATEGGAASPMLAPIPEPKHDLAHEVARRAMQERKKYRRSKLRVDAFLGEWLNPGYFEDITPPPPSAMMVRTAKAELMQNEMVEVFTPMATSSGKSSGGGSLWSGGAKMQSLDEWSQIQDSLPASGAVRESRSRASTVGSDSSPVENGRKSPFRPGSALSPLTSTVPKPELSVYNPPTPQYAVSSSDQIPRGYFAHARNACTNVDFQWDSSRPPQDWGDGGELGEEWSAMHKRFRKGLSSMVEWYSKHDADDRGEDALGFEQAEQHQDGGGEEEEEELVVVLVTHGAGCNALIGALTGQPVLLDVGMASLTMAVRKDDTPDPPATGPSKTRAYDPNLIPSLYEMKLVASSEHLRPTSTASSAGTAKRNDLASVRASLADYKAQNRIGSGSSIDSQPLSFTSDVGPRSNTSALLGSIRRPSATPLSAPGSTLPSRMNSSFPSEGAGSGAATPMSQGLWTPPAGRTPILRAQEQPKSGSLAPLGDAIAAKKTTGPGEGEGKDGGDNMVLDFSTSPPDSRPGTSSGDRAKGAAAPPSINGKLHTTTATNDSAINDGSANESDHLRELQVPGEKVPTALSRGLSQSGLWGNQPSGDKVERAKVSSPPGKDKGAGKSKGRGIEGPKRRWTLDERD